MNVKCQSRGIQRLQTFITDDHVEIDISFTMFSLQYNKKNLIDIFREKHI